MGVTDQRRLAWAVAVGGTLLLTVAYAALGVAGSIIAGLVLVGVAAFLLGRPGAIVTLAAVMVMALAYGVGRSVHAGDDAARVRAAQTSRTRIAAHDRARQAAEARADDATKLVASLRKDVTTLRAKLRGAERKAKRRKPSKRTRRR
jgi:hypothetical protein